MTIEPLDVLIFMNIAVWAWLLYLGVKPRQASGANPMEERVKRLEVFEQAHYRALKLIGEHLGIDVLKKKEERGKAAIQG